jgi:hypothetical protein
MNQPSKDKKKFTFFEQKDVFSELQQAATTQTETYGRIIKVPEIIRTLTLNFANEIRKKQGKEPIDYNPASGKFAPGGVGSAKQAVVNMKGEMAVFDKNGKRLPEWKSVTEIPRLLQVYPKCKITNA